MMDSENDKKSSKLAVGDMWHQLLYALERPNFRMPNFAVLATTPEEKRKARKQVKKEYQQIYMARRCVVDEALAQSFYENPCLDMDGYFFDIAQPLWQAVNELKLPHSPMWIEFPDKKGGVIGCLATEHEKQHRFQLFRNSGDKHDDIVPHPFIYLIQKPEADYASWVDKKDIWGQQNMITLDVNMSTVWGAKHKMFIDEAIIDDWPEDEISEKDQPRVDATMWLGMETSMQQLFHWDTETTFNRMSNTAFTSDKNQEFFKTTGRPLIPHHSYSMRFLVLFLQAWNYAWIEKEEASVNQNKSKKGKRPKIKPYDSYYRCKINLPKPAGVEINPSTPREDAYGKRLHQVRGHWRVYKNEHGEVKRRTWIREHRRGDAALGVVIKDYHLTHEDQ